MRALSWLSCVLGGSLLIGCAENDGVPSLSTDSTESRGGSATGTSAPKTSGSKATGGRSNAGVGGSTAESTGGRVGKGGSAPAEDGGATMGKGGSKSSSGGSVAAGGESDATGGKTLPPSRGGAATGGRATRAAGGNATTGGRATGGAATGGRAAGGNAMTGGRAAGGAATGGNNTVPTTESGGAATLDCAAPMPTGSGTTHCGSYKTGKAGNLSWELWSNSYNSNACITYYSTPAFSAKWNNNGDYLARLGIEWGGKTISQLGEITAEFTYKKTGSGGGYSYIGVYGWAKSPCVEYYIIDDSFNGMPFNPWNMQGKGSATIDGEVYKFFAGTTNGTGGSRCGTPFQQFWSIRQKGRQCGVMTISKHFEEWKKVGMNMDSILEAKILVETGGGQGTVEFPIANVKSGN